jgi:hypothetical protein
MPSFALYVAANCLYAVCIALFGLPLPGLAKATKQLEVIEVSFLYLEYVGKIININ